MSSACFCGRKTSPRFCPNAAIFIMLFSTLSLGINDFQYFSIEKAYACARCVGDLSTILFSTKFLQRKPKLPNAICENALSFEQWMYKTGFVSNTLVQRYSSIRQRRNDEYQLLFLMKLLNKTEIILFNFSFVLFKRSTFLALN